MNYPGIIIPLIIGFAADMLIGDPHWLPHPVRFFGRLISFGEKWLNKGKHRKLKGATMTAALVSAVFLFLFVLLKVISASFVLWTIITSVFVFYGLANHSLIKESLLVIKALKKEGIEAGRKRLGFIVGRDTAALNENQVRTAVLETLAENLSDGVIAPLFFYAVGGVPAMLAYKMANTLDSMIGYKNERYKDFGWFAARLDDVLNFLPARITAFLMVLLTFSWRGLKFIFKYGRQHASPNSGYPEAALAGILNCRLGGPNYYSGKVVVKPYIGDNKRTVSDADVYKACVINFASAFFFILLIVIVTLVFP
jgi:adenosylcobinamide-phosphate synthase